MRCFGMCPENAVQVSYLWVAGLWYGVESLVSIPVLVRVSEAMAARVPVPAAGVTRVLWFPLYLAVLWLTHRLLVRVSWMPVFRTILLATSPTAIYRRYHEPDTHQAEMVERDTAL